MKVLVVCQSVEMHELLGKKTNSSQSSALHKDKLIMSSIEALEGTVRPQVGIDRCKEGGLKDSVDFTVSTFPNWVKTGGSKHVVGGGVSWVFVCIPEY